MGSALLRLDSWSDELWTSNAVPSTLITIAQDKLLIFIAKVLAPFWYDKPLKELEWLATKLACFTSQIVVLIVVHKAQPLHERVANKVKAVTTGATCKAATIV